MDRRRTGQQVFLLRVAVEARHRAQTSSYLRPCSAMGLKIRGEALDVRASHLEQAQLVLLAPGDELAQIEGVGLADPVRPR